MTSLPELSENRSLLLLMAKEILLMQSEIDELTSREQHLSKIKDDYFDLLNKSRQNNNEFMANILSQIIGE